jgi:hypothetical protein
VSDNGAGPGFAVDRFISVKMAVKFPIESLSGSNITTIVNILLIAEKGANAVAKPDVKFILTF